MQQNSQKSNRRSSQIKADAPGFHPLAVTECILEITAAPDPVCYTYSWISGRVLRMPRDMKYQPQSPQRVNDILCVLQDPGGFSKIKGVEIKTKDKKIAAGIAIV